ncbi:DUF4192 family protein [Kineococcus sp. SYSU DK003]|uniref:DUF4192 family protein n=1 Tax=Kineococcus sp. SYSU DK003 TaxID=3383124 RepID=UPI003D7F1152
MTSPTSTGTTRGTDSRPTVVAKSPGDLVAVVPYAFGFHPADSLVLLELRRQGPSGRRRLGFAGRADLPGGPDAPTVAAVTAPALDELLRQLQPGSRVHVLVYDPDATTVAGVLAPGARASATVDHVRARLSASGVDVPEVLLVTADRWRSLSCDRTCCPAAGVPREDAAADRIVAEAVGAGWSAAPDREAVLPLTVPVDAERRRTAAAATARVRRRHADRPVAEVRREVVDAWEDELTGRLAGATRSLPPAAWCGRVLAVLDDVALRDAVLLSGCAGPRTDRSREALLAGEGTAALLSAALDEEFDDRRGAVAAALAVDVARHAAGPAAAQAWAVAAWLDWHAGRSVPALACAQEALVHDPDHRLARLVAAALVRALPARR